MSWERLLALEGGAVGALAIADDPEGTAFAATLSGVFRGASGGEWVWAGRGLISPFVQDVAVSPDFVRDGVVAAATAVSGLHMSYDRGESWSRLDFWGVRPTVTRVAISPDFSRDELVVAGTQYEGVYVTTNRGRSWNGFADGLEDAEISALAVAPGATNGGPILAAADTGVLLRSTDVGRTWRRIEHPGADPLESCAWVNREVAVAGTASGRLLRSMDSGQHWETVWQADDDTVNGIAVTEARNGGRLIVAVTGSGRLLQSNNAGATWQERQVASHGTASALCVAASGGCVLVGTDRNGVLRRTGDNSAAAANAGLVSRPILDLDASSFADDGTLVVGTLQDGVLVSRDGGSTWTSTLDERGLSPATTVRLSPDFPRDGIAGAIAGGQVVWTDDAVASWVRLSGLTANGAASLLEFSPDFAADGHVVVGGLDGLLHISRDRGETWQPVSARPAGGTFLSLAFSPNFGRDRSMVAVVGDENRLVVLRSGDAGESWTRWVEYDSPMGWASVAIPPTFQAELGPVLLAVRDRIATPPANGRGPWPGMQIANGDLAIRQVTVSPDFERDGLVAAATSDGVYLSNSHGHTWSRMDGPLAGQAVERVSITQSDPHRRTIHAALSRGELWQFTA